jgi:hypothetical protein
MNQYIDSIRATIAKAPESQKSHILRESLKSILKQDLFSLCFYLGYKEIEVGVHSEIIASLSANTKRKIICVPRGTFKSSIAAIVYPIWKMINNPNIRILIDSELYSNSITYLRAIKNHLESEEMTSLFGVFKNDSIWREDSILINQRTMTLKEPTARAGGIGTRLIGQHFDFLCGDDYNSPQNTATKDQSQKVIDHFKYNLSILEPTGEYVIIGTRYGEDDLIGWILREILDEKHLAEGKFKFTGDGDNRVE